MVGISVTLKKDFPIIRETLERMGVVNKQQKIIYPSCYCIEFADGQFAVAHFKELFSLQNKDSDFDENGSDKARLRTIVYFLNKWNLVSVDTPEDISEILHQKIDVITKSDKSLYKVVHKFNMYSLDKDSLKNEIT
jgi:hypothetical protein